MRRLFLVGAASLALATPAVAQGTDHSHMDTAGMSHATPVSAKALREIQEVATHNLSLGAPGAAAAAGFRAAFGWIPTMGVHWVNGATMITSGKKIDLQRPSQLMFTRINGRDSLAGAAYAYFTAVGDTIHPPTFDGNPAWHEHATLAPPGQTLVMLHVWFVPSPDGPFAGTNPNLPFWAVGLAAPDPVRMQDAGFSSRVRRAGLALAEVADSAAMFSPLARRNRLVAPSGLSAMRDTVRALLPEFRAAEQAKDATRFDRAVDKAAAQWDAMQAAYVGVGRTDAGRQRIEEYFQMLLGQHGEHQL